MARGWRVKCAPRVSFYTVIGRFQGPPGFIIGRPNLNMRVHSSCSNDLRLKFLTSGRICTVLQMAAVPASSLLTTDKTAFRTHTSPAHAFSSLQCLRTRFAVRRGFVCGRKRRSAGNLSESKTVPKRSVAAAKTLHDQASSRAEAAGILSRITHD